jgi:type I restriction enzyme S subunit
MTNIANLLTEHIDIWTAADTEKKSGRGRARGNASSVYGVKKLRELILELAVRGKLVPQDPNDEPASELLKRIQAEKAKLIAEGKLKKEKPFAPISSDEILFELPHTWVWSRLSDVGFTQTGTTPSKSDLNAFGTDVPFIKPGDIYPNYVEYENEGLSTEGAINGRVALAGSLLMVCIGTIGKCNIIEKDCSFNQQINSLTPFQLNSRYLLIATRANFFQNECWLNSSSTTLSILNKGKWEQIGLPIPPIAEQHCIVAKVDELMKLCDQLEQQHSNAQEAHETLVSQLLATLTQSQNATEFNANWQRIYAHFDVLFTTEASIDSLKLTLLQLAVMGKLVKQDPNEEPASELLKRIQTEKAKLIAEGKIKKEKTLVPITEVEKPFELPESWEWSKLGSIAKKLTDGSHNPPRDSGSGIPMLSSQNVNFGFINFDNPSRYVTEGDFLTENSRTKLEVDDVLLTIVGSLGRAAVIEKDSPKFVLQRSVAAIKTGLLPKYLCLQLGAPFCIDYFEENGKGTAQKGVYLGQLAEMLITVPPLSEQRRIISKVEALMLLSDQLKTSIQQANQQKQTIANVLVAHAVV